YAAELAIAKGAKVVTLSDSGGSISFSKGMTSAQLEELIDYKEVQRGRLKDWSGDGVNFHPEARPWSLVDADVALPCATQHEVEKDDAAALVDRGVKCVAEGANMPCTNDARNIFHEKGVMFGPGKAANAGGVATSCFEMDQNATHSTWAKDRTIDKLTGVMLDIHEQCLEHGPMNNGVVDYGVGADRGGFVKLADAIIAMGV
ncbi:MAG: glutamate dehydrogenase, partial [Phycisphaerales bacterium]